MTQKSLITKESIRLPQRDPAGNKGTFGKLLFICGSESISGAAYLSAKAALRSGCGMVRIYTHAANRPILSSLLPEALISSYKEDDPVFIDWEDFRRCLAWADGVLIGPGLGTGPVALALLKELLSSCRVPLVIDADGLNLIARHQLNLKDVKAPLILTPHLVEFSRLLSIREPIFLDELCSKKEAYAVAYASENHCVLVCKDAITLVADPEGRLCQTTVGNDGMATAGSGDVLAGIISALSASLPPMDAACTGVFLHGSAGDLAAGDLSRYSLIASDLIDYLPKVFVRLEENAG